MTATFTQPTNPAQLQAQLDDKAFVEDLFKQGPDGIRSYFDTYAKAVQDESSADVKELNETVKVEMQTALAEFMRDNEVKAAPAAAAAVTAEPRKMLNFSKGATAYNRRAVGAGLEKALASSDDYDAIDYFYAAYHDKSRLRDAGRYVALEGEINKYMADYSGTVPADGGILLPETLRSEIMSLALESTVVRSRATVIPLSGAKVSFPVVKDDSHASNVFGGIRAYWEDEAEAHVKTQASFGKVSLEPQKLVAAAGVPNDLLADAPALETFIGVNVPEAVAYYEDFAFIEGTGAGQPLGFKNAPAAVTVNKESGQANTTIVADNIFKMYSRLLPNSLGKAVWLANIDTLPQLTKLNVAVGTGGNTIWLPNAVQGVPGTLMGIPLIFTEKMETLGAAGDIMLVDLSKYLIGDRQTIQLSSSAHEDFSSDRTNFKVVCRVDGRPWIQSAITPAKGSNTLSPFVKLQTR